MQTATKLLEFCPFFKFDDQSDGMVAKFHGDLFVMKGFHGGATFFFFLPLLLIIPLWIFLSEFFDMHKN